MQTAVIGGICMTRLSRHSSAQIVTEISSLIHQHVNIMDERGYIIASTDYERIGTFHEGAKKVIEQGLELLIIENDADYIGAKQGINLPIIVDGEIVGVIGVTGKRKQIEVYGQIIKKMTEILVVDTHRKEEKLVAEKIRTRYIEEWVFDNTKSITESFIKRGIGLGIDITLPRRVMVIKIVEGKAESDLHEGQRFLDKIEKKIKKLVGEEHEENLFVRVNTKMVCMVMKRSDALMLSLARTIQQMIKEEYGTLIAIGIDEEQEQYILIHKAYSCAKKAVAAAAMDCQDKLKLYKEITFQLFMNEVPQHIKKEFVYKVFGDASEAHIEEMVSLIEVLIACNGSINVASEALYMHKNTLQYKLNRICEKTGHDPRKLKDIPLIYIAILFFKDLHN